MSECLGQPELAIVRLRMRFAPASPGRLEGYTGSAWRGGLGHELRRAVCRTGAPDCGGCPHLAECDYPLAFETPADGLLGKVDSAPRPFGLAALPTPLGEQELYLTLYGSGVRFLPVLAQALAGAGDKGIGPGRVRFGLRETRYEAAAGSGVWQEFAAATGAMEPARWPPPPGVARVRLVTPLRVRRRERYIGEREFRFSDLFTSVLRRVSLLCRAYGRPLDTDFRGLTARSEEVPLRAADLRWHDWSRYSSRQEKAIAMGGVVGEFAWAPAEAPELWPYLWLGQFTQAGKGTTLGLGWYEMGSQA